MLSSREHDQMKVFEMGRAAVGWAALSVGLGATIGFLFMAGLVVLPAAARGLSAQSPGRRGRNTAIG